METFPHLFCPFLKMWKRLYVETYPQFLILSIFWKCGNISWFCPVSSIFSALVFHISWFCPFFENVETSLVYISLFCPFLKMWKHLYIENVTTFLDFVYFFKVLKHFLILSSFHYFIIVSIPHSGTVWSTNNDRYSDFGQFLKMWKHLISWFCPYLKMWKRLCIETTWGEIVLGRNVLLPVCRYWLLV